jgi:DNA polymerase delta subunit 1
MDFQIVDVVGEDARWSKKTDQPPTSHDNRFALRYTVYLFGRNAQGQSVAAIAHGFQPEFYVRVPQEVFTTVPGGERIVKRFKDELKTQMKFPASDELLSVEFAKMRSLYHFTNGETQTYLHLKFSTKRAFNKAMNVIKPRKGFGPDAGPPAPPAVLCGSQRWRLYDSQVNPLFRLVHERKIGPADWVHLENPAPVPANPDWRQTSQEIEVSVFYKDITPLEGKGLAPVRVCAFDIECVGPKANALPVAADRNNPVITIGCTTTLLGDSKSEPERWVGILSPTTPDTGAAVDALRAVSQVECFADEFSLLEGWANYINKSNPDIITGYNIFSFDYTYIWERLQHLGRAEDFPSLSRILGQKASITQKKLNSSAIGSAVFTYIKMDGRIGMDCMEYMQQNVKLPSYKLNDVAKKFLKMQKNDMPYENLFHYYHGTTEQRVEIARYCIQDCLLCNRLQDNREIIMGAIGMANVTTVPISQLFLKGQGVKSLSLAARFARERNMVIPSLDKVESQGYEGAIVLEANAGVYFSPVGVNDFESLYPSSCISHNLSPDTKVQIDGPYDNLPNVEYQDVKWETDGETHHHRFVVPKPASPEDLAKDREAAERSRSGRGLMCEIEIYLLKNRKIYKKLMEKEEDATKKAIYNNLQLAYKLVANSLYGQLGNPVGDIRDMDVASCITAVGRQMLITARATAQELYPGTLCVYGDTDSVFNRFPLKTPQVPGVAVQPPEIQLALRQETMECCIRLQKVLADRLPWPHRFNFEKVYDPFILYTKKRYCGMYYELPTSVPYLDSKGIVLKRRDNAPIVKDVYKKTVDILMTQRDATAAIKYVAGALAAVVEGKEPLEKFVITKKLKARSDYKNPDAIAHRVLADRMTERDPGNAPQNNTRMEYALIYNTRAQERKLLDAQTRSTGKLAKKVLQGDQIEDITYIRQKNIPLDYVLYLQNQLKKPLAQLFELFGRDIEKEIIAPLVRKEEARRLGLRPVSAFFKKT